MTRLDGVDQIVGSIVDALKNVGKSLCVRGPLYNDLVETVGFLEVTMIRQMKSMI